MTWEIPGDMRMEPGEDKNSAEYNAIHSTILSRQLLQGNGSLQSRDQFKFWKIFRTTWWLASLLVMVYSPWPEAELAWHITSLLSKCLKKIPEMFLWLVVLAHTHRWHRTCTHNLALWECNAEPFGNSANLLSLSKHIWRNITQILLLDLSVGESHTKYLQGIIKRIDLNNEDIRQTKVCLVGWPVPICQHSYQQNFSNSKDLILKNFGIATELALVPGSAQTCI